MTSGADPHADISPLRSSSARCFARAWGNGVNALMEDDEVLCFLRNQAAGSKIVLSVCTGALLSRCGGPAQGEAGDHPLGVPWPALLFGALPVDARVVEDGSLVTAAGVTSGIDAALRVAAMLRGDAVAQRTSFTYEYAARTSVRQRFTRVGPCSHGRSFASFNERTSQRLAPRSRSVLPPKYDRVITVKS